MASIPPISIPESVPTSALTSATNAFASKSPNDVYLFLEENREKFKGLDLTAWNWIVIDEKGFETETCLLGSRVLPDDEEDGDGNGEVVGYKICRIPWTRAWLMLANLDIANMGFEEWVDEKRGPVDEDFGAWAWVGPFDGAEKEDEEVLAKRGEAVRQGVEGGYI
ncbi:hypothetical protein BDV29DRAFT_160525 [Aspergillus leporis]|jgi:hypothetical protein|uniref:Uncharacterized protein n=1 Tax=Aspergillus leporis TaxID=41062 RepID=A0A5N5WPH5_9EURO|nr:hypothetical protein BDV29DRAFT_160525 [Aspergillus leporis]